MRTKIFFANILIVGLIGLNPSFGHSSESPSLGKSDWWPFSPGKMESVTRHAGKLQSCECGSVSGDASEVESLVTGAKGENDEGNKATNSMHSKATSVEGNETENNFSSDDVGTLKEASGEAGDAASKYKATKEKLEEALGIAKGIPGQIDEDCAEGKVDHYTYSAEKLIERIEQILPKVEDSLAAAEGAEGDLAEAAAVAEEHYAEVECDESKEESITKTLEDGSEYTFCAAKEVADIERQDVLDTDGDGIDDGTDYVAQEADTTIEEFEGENKDALDELVDEYGEGSNNDVAAEETNWVDENAPFAWPDSSAAVADIQ